MRARDEGKASHSSANRQQGQRKRRPGGGQRLDRTGRWVHQIGALALIIGLFLPFTTAGEMLAAPGEFSPLTPSAGQSVPAGITQVIAFGDFQGEIGCGDWDSSCSASSLSNNGGIWSGTFAVSPGFYSAQFAVNDQNGNQLVFGGPESFSVNDGQAGVYFSYNAHTNQVRAQSVDAIYSVQTDFGNLVPAPSGGTLDILVQSQGGSTGVQLYADGSPAGDPQQASLSPGWTRISLDTSGNVVGSQGLTYGTLGIQRLDQNGSPVGGGCYQLLSGGLVNQACADGGGNATMTFPEGLNPGTYTLVEVQAPAGFDPIPDQTVDLQPGDNVVQLQQPGGADDDDNGTMDDDGGFIDDDDGFIDDGDDGFIDDGDDGVGGDEDDGIIDDGSGDQPTDPADNGTVQDGFPSAVVITLQDDQGNPLGDACWELIQNSNVVQESCDLAAWGDTNPGNGRTAFDSVPPGTYTLRQSSGPEGAPMADDRDITISGDGADVNETVTVAALTPATEPASESGDVTVLRENDQGNAVGGACFVIRDDGGNAISQDVCDEAGDVADDGRTDFFDVPAGTWWVHETRTPEGYEPAQPVQFTVNPGSTVDVPVRSAAIADDPTDTPATDVPSQTGSLQVDLYNPDGDLVGGACWQLLQNGDVAAQACDIDDGIDRFPFNGKVGMYDVPVGTYTLHNSGVPDGYQQVPDAEVDITATDALREVTIEPLAADPTEEPPTEEPATEEPTDVPATEEPTDVPATEEPTETPAAPGDLVVTLQDDDGASIGGACFQLVNGTDVVAESCDLPGQDQNPNNGRTGFYGVPSGTYTLQQEGTVDGFEPVSQDNVTIEPNGQTDITLTATTTDQPATEEPTDVPATEEPTEEPDTSVDPGGTTGVLVSLEGVDTGGQQICVTLDTTGGIGMRDPPSGCSDDVASFGAGGNGILLENVPPGTYAFDVTSGPEELVNTEWPSVTVNEGEITNVDLQPQDAAVGSLEVVVVDGTEEPITETGTCLTVVGATGSICDDETGDASTDPGIILIEDLEPGIYDITVESVPSGYEASTGLTGITINPDAVTEVDLPLTAQTGTIQVVATNRDGQAIGGACWALFSGDTEIASQCDDDTNGGIANDGYVTFTGITPDTYTLRETQAPSGYQAVPDQDITVNAGDNAPLFVAHDQLTGTVRAAITANGTPVDGTCLTLGDRAPVCDGGEGDTDTTAGIIQIENVPVGEYQATLGQVPSEYQTPQPQSVIVSADEPANLTFDLLAANGTVRADITGPDGPVGGTCLELVGLTTVCDNDADDGNPEPGVIQIDGVAPDTYEAVLSSLPEGYATPAAQDAPVVAGETVDLTFTLELLPPDVADLRILVQTGDGDPVAGGCVVLSQENTVVVGPVCDNGNGDSNQDDGVIQLSGVPVGSYGAALTSESTAAIPGYRSSDTPSVTVAADEDNQGLITVVLDDAPATGSLELITRNNATNERLGGACYTLTGSETITVCDNEDPDVNTQDGVIQMVDVAAGDYTLAMSTTPAGFQTAGERTITVDAAADNSYEIRLDPLPQPSTLTVLKVDPNDEPLGNSCFALRQGTSTIATRCDATDNTPNDGTLTFPDIPAGTYLLVETRSPSPAYGLASPVSVTMVAGVDQEVRVVNNPKPGRLVVTKVNAADASELLDNACFALEGERNYGPFCDGDDGVVDGRTVFPNVAPGTYTLVETSPPPGFLAADDREVTINAGSPRNITVANRAAPPPPESGTLVVTKVDADGNRLAGACFRLYDGNRAVTHQVCDAADGASDGLITFNRVPVGTWTLRETVTPSTDYQFADLVDVTIRNTETTRITVENTLKPGRLQVNKTNTDGRPLQGACFDLREDDGGARCTDAYGVVVFTGLEPGRYTLVETRAPYGYQQAADVNNIEVRPGQTRVVNVVDQRIPPPANTGSVQVQKFYCPAGEQGSRTQFFGGAQGTQQLARTAGCERGNAVFTLVGDNGTGGPGEFHTGSDGQYQVAVTEGLYRLTEIDPQLGENQSSVRVRVNRGQMTTVIVINYIAPPQPDPIQVNVAKYTCAPSFNGTRYEDFMEGCTASEQLTNTITIRLAGPVTTKAITGDGGERGRTTFTNLTPGTYTISEERPFTTPTDYLFCGFANNAVDQWKAVNGSLTIKLNYGDTLTCTFHNIPEVLTPETGTILVRKFVCEVKTPPKGYDWDKECGLSHQNASFSLARYNPESQSYGEPVVVQANPDGFVRFTHLAPGSYQLREVDGAWCHAESNSVNAQGDVVVQANKLSEVWIFNCVEPQTPPNTGSGDAAPNPPPATMPEDGTGPVALPAITLPVLAAAAWLGNRRHAA